MKILKGLFVVAVTVTSFASCSPVVYAHTENDITRSGKKFEAHHVEVISLPKTKTI